MKLIQLYTRINLALRICLGMLLGIMLGLCLPPITTLTMTTATMPHACG